MGDPATRDAATGWAGSSRPGGVDRTGDCAQTVDANATAKSAENGSPPERSGMTRNVIAVTCNLQLTSHLTYDSRCMPSRAKPFRAAVAARRRRSRCPVSCALDAVGDRWTLLVVRDLMRGKRRFAELVDTPEGIPTNILSDRLKRLTAAGIVRSRRYSDHPPRVDYALTAKGEALRPVMRAMVEWGVRHAGGRQPPPVAVPPPKSWR